uniref:Small ribosomal subunit protein uS8c n=1 Tax=Lepocinclis playfairiana TaxID=1403386 RepID=A0A3G3LLH2_9EUGL|nr:ribosomal protein S8 [Lepocinclis playfairiana]AYQ93556.1 ribosomal protein S8 [Lepocinclis playfairiana]
MTSNDLISDMLTRIRNANLVSSEKVLVPYTKVNSEIARILKDEGFIESFEQTFNTKSSNSNSFPFICIVLKFKKGLRQKPYISFIKRISKPGLRSYVNANNIPKVWGGIGVAVLSTSSGLMTNKEAKLRGLGGEVLFYIW